MHDCVHTQLPPVTTRYMYTAASCEKNLTLFYIYARHHGFLVASQSVHQAGTMGAYCGSGIHGNHDVLTGLAGLSDDISNDLSVGVLDNALILGTNFNRAGILLTSDDTDNFPGAAAVDVGLGLYEDLHTFWLVLMLTSDIGHAHRTRCAYLMMNIRSAELYLHSLN